MLNKLIERIGLQGARKASLPIVPWLVIGDVIEISYSVYKVVRDAHDKKQKRRGKR